MKTHTCLIISREPDEFKNKLQAYDLPNLKIIIGHNKATIKSNILTSDIIFGNPPMIKKYINQAKNVKWVQSSFAGVDALIDQDLPKNYILTNVKDTYGKAMAEYVFAHILSLKRKLSENQKWQSEHQWNQFSYDVIEGETIGIVGTGSIGKEIARVAKTFGIHTRGMNTEGTATEYFNHTFSSTQLPAFLAGLNYVVCVLPNTPETKYFFNSDTFSQMDSRTWFINIGRGQNVCEKDLVEALKNKKIAGAILDVFETEPLPEDSPLWDIENLHITPHVSGYVVTDMAFKIFAKNYQLFHKGKSLKYQVDFRKGY